MVHLLHVEMVALVREILSKFMKPNAIALSAKEILKVDVRSRDFQLSDKRLGVGKSCYSLDNRIVSSLSALNPSLMQCDCLSELSSH